MMLTTLFTVFFMLLGALFIFIGCLGIFRLPDVLCRAHALTKAITLGICSLLVAAWINLAGTGQGWKLFVVIAFQLATIPISGHLLALVVKVKRVPLASLRLLKGSEE